MNKITFIGVVECKHQFPKPLKTRKKRRPYELHFSNGEVHIKWYYSFAQANGHYIHLCIAKSIDYTKGFVIPQGDNGYDEDWC